MAYKASSGKVEQHSCTQKYINIKFNNFVLLAFDQLLNSPRITNMTLNKQVMRKWKSYHMRLAAKFRLDRFSSMFSIFFSNKRD